MNISKTASYSLNILSYMAANMEAGISATLLHEKLEIPYQYLRQILKDLTKNGFIQSTRGRRGGYTFGRPLEGISLADIIESVDGEDSLDKCILGFGKCPFDMKCAMHSIWETTRNTIQKTLKETTLATIQSIRLSDISNMQ